jgi:hypothetical protein
MGTCRKRRCVTTSARRATRWGLNIIGPHEDQVPNVLYLASVGLLDATTSFTAALKDSEPSDRLQAFWTRLEQLPK